MPQVMLAYLDAGTGSIILQAVLGGTAAVAVAVKLWWRKALHVLHIRRDTADEAPTLDGGSGPG